MKRFEIQKVYTKKHVRIAQVKNLDTNTIFYRNYAKLVAGGKQKKYELSRALTDQNIKSIIKGINARQQDYNKNLPATTVSQQYASKIRALGFDLTKSGNISTKKSNIELIKQIKSNRYLNPNLTFLIDAKSSYNLAKEANIYSYFVKNDMYTSTGINVDKAYKARYAPDVDKFKQILQGELNFMFYRDKFLSWWYDESVEQVIKDKWRHLHDAFIDIHSATNRNRNTTQQILEEYSQWENSSEIVNYFNR